MNAPYRSATLVAPASFELPAATVIARWAIALRVFAAVVAFVPALARGGTASSALELGACAALSLAGSRFARASSLRSARWLAVLSTALSAACLLLWQPLVSAMTDSFGPSLGVTLDEHLDGATQWRTASWLSPLILWVALRVEASRSQGPAATESALELEPDALRAQSIGLRSVSSSIAAIVLSMVLSVVIAIFFEMRGAHWHTSAFIRGTGIILAGLFAGRAARSLGRLQRWAPSIASLSGGLALWSCAVVGWLFVIRGWLRVLLTPDGRAHITEAFAGQGVIATTTLAAIAMVLWASSQLSARAEPRRVGALPWVAALALASTTALMARVHVTIADFVMRTPEHYRLVATTLATAVVAIACVSLYARRVAAALDAKSSAPAKKSD